MYCKNCGNKLEQDSNFCEKCGTKVTFNDDVNLQKGHDNQTIENKLNNEDKNTQIVEKNIDQTDQDEQKVGLDVTDLKPDDLDDLMPKKSYSLIIFITFVFILVGIGLFIYYDLTKSGKSSGNKNIDYQEIIDEYGKSIEDVASEYLIDHELINDFDEIKDKINYKKHKVSCENVFINIDGTVYLSDCSVDNKKVDEVYGRRKNILTKDSDEACYINSDTDTNTLGFYVDSELISVYECEHDKCELYQTEDFKYNSCLDMIALIQDGDNKYLYNYQAGQQIMDSFSEVVPIKNSNKYIGFIVRDTKTEKYGYIDTRGTIKIPLLYDSLGLISDNRLYEQGFNLSADKLVAKKDGKAGVIKFSNGEEVMPFKYEQIYLGANDYYVIRENKNYYLVDKQGNKVLEKSYKMIFAFDSLLLVNENDKLKFIDYKGNQIISDELDIYIDYKEEPIRGIFGYNATKEDNKILININKANDNGYETINYIYNIDTKKLEEV